MKSRNICRERCQWIIMWRAQMLYWISKILMRMKPKLSLATARAILVGLASLLCHDKWKLKLHLEFPDNLGRQWWLWESGRDECFLALTERTIPDNKACRANLSLHNVTVSSIQCMIWVIAAKIHFLNISFYFSICVKNKFLMVLMVHIYCHRHSMQIKNWIL